MVLVSATAFGTLSVFAKLAYAQGLGTEQTLAFRFFLAALGMWALAIAFRQPPHRIPRRRLVSLVALGAIVYTGQSLAYFLALRSLPASLCVLIVYVYPSLVVVVGWAFLGRHVSRRHVAALAASFAGVALLVGGAKLEAGWGLVFALASPAVYTAYIFLGERLMKGVPAVGASAAIMTGTAAAFCILAAADGQLRLPASGAAWAVGFGIAIVPTMIAISFFMAGLPLVGAARAALLSTWEPVVTVLLAVLLLGDRLSLVQALGGVMVIAAVLAVQGAPVAPVAPQALK